MNGSVARRLRKRAMDLDGHRNRRSSEEARVLPLEELGLVQR